MFLQNDIRDKLTPIDLKLTFTTPNDPPKKKRRRRDTTHTPPIPIMNTAIADTAVAEIEFAKRCGDDEICSSNLEKKAYYQVLKNGNWSDLTKWVSVDFTVNHFFNSQTINQPPIIMSVY